MLCKALGFTRPHGAGVRGETSRHLRLRVSSSSSFFFSLLNCLKNGTRAGFIYSLRGGDDGVGVCVRKKIFKSEFFLTNK